MLGMFTVASAVVETLGLSVLSVMMVLKAVHGRRQVNLKAIIL